jgi:hypothetical protein
VETLITICQIYLRLKFFISSYCILFQRGTETEIESKNIAEDSLNQELTDQDLLYEKVRA